MDNQLIDNQRKTTFDIPVKNLMPIKFRRSDDHLILIASHAYWKEKLCNAITNKTALDILKMLNDELSDLGHWLYSEEEHPQVARLKNYYELKKRNHEFHVQASKVAEYINAEKYDVALRLTECTSAFEASSNAVIDAIFLLKKEFDKSIKSSDH
jgi:hypothetical protein